MPVCGRFRKSPQAGPCKTAQRSGCRHTHLTESRGEGGGERPFPRLSLIFRPMSGIGALITGRPVSSCCCETAPIRVRGTFRFQGRTTGPRPVSGCCGETAPFRVRGTFRFQGRATGPRPVSANVSSPSCPTAFFANPDPGPPPRSSFRLIRCLPEAQFPSVLGPAEGEGSGRPSVARRSLRGRILRFPPLSAGAVFPGFFLLPPDGSVRHMTYRNRAIVPPRCGLQRAGSVPPRSAERRAVRRPRSGRATADGSPPVHGFRPSCGTDSAAPGGRLLGRRGIRRPPPVFRRVSVILPFRINKRPPPLDKRLRRSYLCRVSVSRAPPASGNQVYLGRPPSTASRAIREIELIPPARTRTSCGRAPQRSVRFFPGLRPRQALPIPALAGCGA